MKKKKKKKTTTTTTTTTKQTNKLPNQFELYFHINISDID
jgi:hypothetical protein